MNNKKPIRIIRKKGETYVSLDGSDRILCVRTTCNFTDDKFDGTVIGSENESRVGVIGEFRIDKTK